MNWEKLCANLSVAVENWIANSHKKKGWPHFKLKLND